MTKREREFIAAVWSHYEREGRHDLPWREPADKRGNFDPYRIHVSEIMLQQTQVPRVLLKYDEFLKKFPTVRALAEATLADVLRVWQGLGYNRRAKLLRECAQTLVRDHRNTYLNTYEGLRTLPGIGPYTAGAIMAFAHNEPVAFIETNIRTVYLHHFFRGEDQVPDTKIMSYIERTLDRERPREWYYALMDYGAHLKRTIGNQNARSRHYAKQSKFKGSDREIRGAILRMAASRPFTLRSLPGELKAFERSRLKEQLAALIREGMLEKAQTEHRLPR